MAKKSAHGKLPKGKRLPHGYAVKKGHQTKKHKGIDLPANEILPHGYKTEKGKKAKKYKKGGRIKLIKGII